MLCDDAKRAFAALTVLVASLAVPGAAFADEGRLTLDWDKVLSDVRSLSAPRPETRSLLPKQNAPAEPTRWVGLSPHVSLVARDWGEAHRIAGGHLALTDEIRLSRSSRMVFTRVRLADGRFAPFAHLGIGQFRLDPDHTLVIHRREDVAAQMGGGFELRIRQGWALALEWDFTVLYREGSAPRQTESSSFWGTFAVTRAVF
jgi:hypothetical protein